MLAAYNMSGLVKYKLMELKKYCFEFGALNIERPALSTILKCSFGFQVTMPQCFQTPALH